ncbi:MAG: tripeptide aminopeptidase PepT [Spirochaetaceae bacterium]|jgi:tripeptide aminopeptidase|nr:tripeptide aminopeptidase PepT [Spirochaetaceae bacterium]
MTSPDTLRDLLVPRFLRYVGIDSTSYNKAGQRALAQLLKDELIGLGLKDVTLTEDCFVIARLAASAGFEAKPCIGFLSHLDTSPDAPGDKIQPVIKKNQQGEEIISSDGTTLLGADDKAGIAEIMGALEYLIQHPQVAHGPLEIIFSPDEEIGGQLKGLDVPGLHAQAFYTMDGGAYPEIEAECFEAWSAGIVFTGRSIHPGTARGALLNAVSMAASFCNLLPRNESPEATDGRYGFYCPTGIKGTHESAELELIIRDFSKSEIERRLRALESFARTVEAQFPGGKVCVNTEEQYRNMKEKIDAEPEVMDKLFAAGKKLGMPLKLVPIRGGTDGAALCQRGIPCPNIFTGGQNFHSKDEFLNVSEMIEASRLIIELIKIWTE